MSQKTEIINAIIEVYDENTILKFENEGLKAQLSAMNATTKEDGSGQSNVVTAIANAFDLDRIFGNLGDDLLDDNGNVAVSPDKYIDRITYQTYYSEARAFSKYCSVSEAVSFFKGRLMKEYESRIAKQKKSFADSQKEGGDGAK